VTWKSSGNADFYPKSARSRSRGAAPAHPVDYDTHISEIPSGLLLDHGLFGGNPPGLATLPRWTVIQVTWGRCSIQSLLPQRLALPKPQPRGEARAASGVVSKISVLRSSSWEPTAAEMDNRVEAHMPGDDSLRCSFCGRTQDVVGRLICKAGTPPSRAYICSECVRYCYSILQDDESEAKPDSDHRE
jgi:hypothetical protein